MWQEQVHMCAFVYRESERLLSNKPVGCFLIRVSESRFGYTLSYRWAHWKADRTSFTYKFLLPLCIVFYWFFFRAQGRCKHYMIDQTRSGKFLIVGMRRVYKSLKEMVSVHKKVITHALICLRNSQCALKGICNALVIHSYAVKFSFLTCIVHRSLS